MGVPVLSDFQQTTITRTQEMNPLDVVTTELGMVKHNVHEIDTGESKLIRSVLYRIAPGWRAELREEIQLLVKDGIMVSLKSPWSFPMVPVRKKETNAIRLCIDYRRLNKVTKADPYQMPMVLELLDNVARATWLTKLDMNNGLLPGSLDKNR